MFFRISHKLDSSFSNNYHLIGDIFINVDAGWEEYSVGGVRVIFKGYFTDRAVSQSSIASWIKAGYPATHGNFIAITVSNNSFTIRHDKQRAFPLFADTDLHTIHNLPEGYTFAIGPDKIVTVDLNFNLHMADFDLLGYIDMTPVSKNEAIDLIYSVLFITFKKFLSHNTLPIRIFISGGIDSLVCWSFLKKLGAKYEILTEEYISPTRFVEAHLAEIKEQYWGYNQIHSFDEPTVFVSGAMGDEIMMRGPYTGHKWLAYHNTCYQDELRPEHHHYFYHLRPKNTPYYSESSSGKSKLEVVREILASNAHDFQHWHLEKTLTFTPFKDLQLTKLLLRLSKNDLMGQILDSEISKELVRRNDPNLLRHLERFKNEVLRENLPLLQFKADE